MERWRRSDVAPADADLGQAMGEEPERGLGQLRPADILAEDRREMDALRQQPGVAGIGAVPHHLMELWPGAGGEKSGALVCCGAQKGAAARKSFHANDDDDR